VIVAFGLIGTAASVWWFALKPRRKRPDSDQPEE
jgi:hypothetical protein